MFIRQHIKIPFHILYFIPWALAPLWPLPCKTLPLFLEHGFQALVFHPKGIHLIYVCILPCQLMFISRIHRRNLENFYETEPGMKQRVHRLQNITALELCLIFKIKNCLVLHSCLYPQKSVWMNVIFSKNSYPSQSCSYYHHSKYSEDCAGGPEGGWNDNSMYTHTFSFPSYCQRIYFFIC